MKKNEQKFNTLAEAINITREKHKITQRELSRRTGIDNNTIAKIEKGERKKPNILSLKKLSFALGLDSDNLLELAGYTADEIDISNNVMGANMCMIKDNGKIILMEEVLMDDDCKKMAYPVIVELIDNCDITNLKYMKDKSKEDINKIGKGLKMIRNDFVKKSKTIKTNK